jgi:hypothetical protein
LFSGLVSAPVKNETSSIVAHVIGFQVIISAPLGAAAVDTRFSSRALSVICTGWLAIGAITEPTIAVGHRALRIINAISRYIVWYTSAAFITVFALAAAIRFLAAAWDTDNPIAVEIIVTIGVDGAGWSDALPRVGITDPVITAAGLASDATAFSAAIVFTAVEARFAIAVSHAA